MLEYPKALYLRGLEDLDAYVTVHGPDEEREARAKGYRGLYEALQDDAPVEGGESAAEAPKRRGRPSKAPV